MKMIGAATALGSVGTAARGAAPTPPDAGFQWFATTEARPWSRPDTPASITPAVPGDASDIIVTDDKPHQTMSGFGASFSEISWAALSALSPEKRDTVMRALFAPGVGLNLNFCRTPIGANDFATSWYSYNETPGDFAMSRFSLDRDDKSLVPFIHAAQALRPGLRLWASPWSPPVWMKRNGHYALSPPNPGAPPTGITASQIDQSGGDVFILEERHLKAYALYFRKYIDGYRARGIPVEMVMPQNEFNSAQSFPSCTWTPEGLARFIPILDEQMDQVGVDVFFGTLERSDLSMLTRVMNVPAARKAIKGVGIQWAGRDAAALVQQAYPELPIYQTEQECGDGKNDWRYARYAWSLMKTYLRAGATCYNYWNIATPLDGKSTWGWKQNSLVTVDLKNGAHKFTHEYYLFKHLSHFVEPGAVRIPAISWTGYDNALAFKNRDGRIVILVQNDMRQDMPIRISVRGKILAASLPADSFNTFVI